MPDERSLARKSATRATSSMVAIRPSEVMAAAAASASATGGPRSSLRARLHASEQGLGRDRAGCDRIDPDATSPDLDRGRADDAEHRVLAGHVGRDVGVAPPGVERRDRDDRRAVAQVRERVREARGDARDVDAHDVLPLAGIERGQAPPGRHDPGCEHEHVDAVEGRGGAGDAEATAASSRTSTSSELQPAGSTSAAGARRSRITPRAPASA